MGMFDWVDFKMPCPKCGQEVDGFQSKSGECTMELVKPSEVTNFYSWCENCGTQIEFFRKDEPDDDILKHFRMVVEEGKDDDNDK